MIANANYNSSPTASTGSYEEGTVSTVYLTVVEPVMFVKTRPYSPPVSLDSFLKPINLFKEDEFLPEEVCKKSIQMESKRFVPSVVTRINRGRG